MFGINKAVVSGNITRDPEERATTSGLEVCRFGICHSKRVKHGETWEDVPQFFDCTAFGAMARQLAKLKKGQKVVVSGELSYRAWETDGQKRSKVEMVVQDFVDCTAPGVKQGRGPSQSDVYDEDIPF